MKKKIFFGISAFILLSIAIFAYFQLVRPLSVTEAGIKVIAMTQKNLEFYKEEYRSGRALDYDAQAVRVNDVFPSDDNNDYCRIVICLKLKNRSLLTQGNISGYVLGEDENSMIILKKATVVPEYVDKLSSREMGVMSLLVYRGDMTDDELAAYIKKQSIIVSYESDIKSGTMKVKLSRFDIKIYKGE